MVMRVDVIAAAVDSVRSEHSRVLLMDPIGQPFKQGRAQELTHVEHLILFVVITKVWMHVSENASRMRLYRLGTLF